MSPPTAERRPVRVLGIDPGLRLTGYGCVELRPGAIEPSLVEAGVLRFKATDTLSVRLGQLSDDLGGLLDELRPTLMVVEKVFSHTRHARTAIIMGHARGVILVEAHKRGVALGEFAPTEVKRAVAGNGHASKAHMQRAVMAQCGLKQVPQPPDVADALALALCAARRWR